MDPTKSHFLSEAIQSHSWAQPLLPHGTACARTFCSWAVWNRKSLWSWQNCYGISAVWYKLKVPFAKEIQWFCCCIWAVSSLELVLCHQSKRNYFNFTLRTLGTYFPPFSNSSNLASALFAVLAVIFWDNCRVVQLEITQAAKPNLSYCWIVPQNFHSVNW